MFRESEFPFAQTTIDSDLDAQNFLEQPDNSTPISETNHVNEEQTQHADAHGVATQEENERNSTTDACAKYDPSPQTSDLTSKNM